MIHAPWTDAVRDTRLGGLVLGFGFLWSDLACYTVGIVLAVLLDRAIARLGLGGLIESPRAHFGRGRI